MVVTTLLQGYITGYKKIDSNLQPEDHAVQLTTVDTFSRDKEQ
jgi:hypothetical protein